MLNKDLPHNHGHLSEKFRMQMPKSDIFENVSELLKLMSDGKRAYIFWLLCHCEECVINISALLEISSSAVSHHLKLLKTSGVIVSRRVGQEVYYTAAQTPRSEVLHRMIEEIVEVTCPGDECHDEANVHNSSVGIINDVRDYLISDLKRRPTIDELSIIFLINKTTLKTTFKTVFGQPIAAYMKEFRIKRAMELLKQGDMSISEVASTVGYENQSKFTKAFKDVMGVLPKDFKKLNL